MGHSPVRRDVSVQYRESGGFLIQYDGSGKPRVCGRIHANKHCALLGSGRIDQHMRRGRWSVSSAYWGSRGNTYRRLLCRSAAFRAIHNPFRIDRFVRSYNRDAGTGYRAASGAGCRIARPRGRIPPGYKEGPDTDAYFGGREREITQALMPPMPMDSFPASPCWTF